MSPAEDPPHPLLALDELRELEAAFQRAVATGDRSRLRELGYGEISVVMAWPPDEPAVAVKRLPPFASVAAHRAYAEVVDRYLALLRGARVSVVPTDVVGLPRPDGSVVGFHLQPVQPAERLALNVVRAASPSVDHPVVPAIVDAVVRATTGAVGVDAQLANWVWDGTEVHQLDLTTPFLVGDDGAPVFDMDPFLAVLPVLMRPVVRREMVELVQRWLTPRGALLDVVANLHKEHLEHWVEPVLVHVNGAVTPAITPAEALKVHRFDRRLWPALLRLEKAQRWWIRSIRHRPYEFLLPERTTYGERR